MNLIQGIDIDNLIKAQTKFEEYRQTILREQDRAGAIQAFEYTYEMSWKTMKKILEKKGLKEIYTPKDCFREAASAGLISDPTIWFEYIEVRNLTVHTYNEDIAHKVVEIFEKFSFSVKELITNYNKLK